jgi:diketogulonate reductase-like aldo/keto reductase
MIHLADKNDTYELSNGVRIPCIGYGTYKTPADETGKKAVKGALALGFRHIDTATSYHNEEMVGEAIKGKRHRSWTPLHHEQALER